MYIRNNTFSNNNGGCISLYLDNVDTMSIEKNLFQSNQGVVINVEDLPVITPIRFQENIFDGNRE